MEEKKDVLGNEEVAAYEFPEKEAMTQHYEALVLSTQVETDEAANALHAEVKKEVEALSGTVTKEEMMPNQDLAYSVNNTRKGFYMVTEFDLETTKLHELNEKLRIRKDIARFLIIKKRVATDEEVKEHERIQGVIDARRTQKMQKNLNEMEEKKQEEAKAQATEEKKEDKKATKPEDKKSVEEGIEKLLSDDLEV